MVAGEFDRFLIEKEKALTEDVAEGSVLRIEDGDQGSEQRARKLIEVPSGRLVGASVYVSTPASQNDALALIGSVDWLLVDHGAAAPMITAENLLSVAEKSGTRIAVTVRNALDVQGLAFALDRGVDAVVCSSLSLAADDGLLLREALQIAKAQRLERVEADPAAKAAVKARSSGGIDITLEQAEITAVVDGGVADRVALDFTTLLGHDEGCLVGSSAKALVLVHGETVPSGFVPPRPFRVNAGPVHAYVLMADGGTKYLSEVCAGDRVLVARVGGGCGRAAVVGRCKTETRPMLRVEFATAANATGQVFLQQAETVRIAREAHTGPLPVTCASASDHILVRCTDRGTHVGRQIDARVDEK